MPPPPSCRGGCTPPPSTYTAAAGAPLIPLALSPCTCPAAADCSTSISSTPISPSGRPPRPNCPLPYGPAPLAPSPSNSQVQLKEVDQREVQALAREATRLQVLERLATGQLLEPDDGRQRCGKCRELGHTQKSKYCPMYGVDDAEEAEPDEVFRDGTVKQKHAGGELKIVVNKDKLKEKEQQAEATGKMKLKIDVTKTKEGERAELERAFRDNVNRTDRKQEARVGRKAGSALVKLNELLLSIVKPLCGRGMPYGDFVEPAAKAAGAYYLRVIAKPMELSTIMAKAKNHHGQGYRQSAAFREDVALIRSNCEEYNRQNSNRFASLPPLARRLVETIEADLRKQAARVTELDRALREEDAAPALEKRMVDGKLRLVQLAPAPAGGSAGARPAAAASSSAAFSSAAFAPRPPSAGPSVGRPPAVSPTPSTRAPQAPGSGAPRMSGGSGGDARDDARDDAASSASGLESAVSPTDSRLRLSATTPSVSRHESPSAF